MSLLENAQIAADLDSLLQEAGWCVELNGASVPVPQDAKMTVLYRSYHETNLDVGFGTHHQALVAIGGVRGLEDGFLQAGICFARLYYSPDKRLITVDSFTDLK